MAFDVFKFVQCGLRHVRTCAVWPSTHSHYCSVAFDTQKPGGATRPLVAAIHTITTTPRMNVWLLAAMLLPKPCLPLIQACARAFPPASQRLLAGANAFIWNTSVALVEASTHCS